MQRHKIGDVVRGPGPHRSRGGHFKDGTAKVLPQQPEGTAGRVVGDGAGNVPFLPFRFLFPIRAFLGGRINNTRAQPKALTRKDRRWFGVEEGSA